MRRLVCAFGARTTIKFYNSNDGDSADDDEWVGGIDIICASTQENLSSDTFQ